MELNSPEVNVEVNENMSKIVDSILLLLSSKSFDDIYTVQGKFKLKDEITTRVNRFLVTGHVKDVYYTEFVIQ
jgi:flagellar FliL protein